MGWTVTVAFDAMQAMMFAMRVQPDVILLDINMPGETGVEALKKLKVSNKTAMIPLVILSGSIESGDEIMVRALGAEGFLRSRPVDAIHSALCGLTGLQPV